MKIDEKTFKAVRDSQKILAEYIVPDSGISDRDVISSLLGVLDDRELVKHTQRLEESPNKAVDMRDVEEINSEVYRALHQPYGDSKFPGLSYEKGVVSALGWVLCVTDETPME